MVITRSNTKIEKLPKKVHKKKFKTKAQNTKSDQLEQYLFSCNIHYEKKQNNNKQNERWSWAPKNFTL